MPFLRGRDGPARPQPLSLTRRAGEGCGSSGFEDGGDLVASADEGGEAHQAAAPGDELDDLVDGIVEDVGMFRVAGSGEAAAVGGGQGRVAVGGVDEQQRDATVAGGLPDLVDAQRGSPLVDSPFEPVEGLLALSGEVELDDGPGECNEPSGRCAPVVAGDGADDLLVGAAPVARRERLGGGEDQGKVSCAPIGIEGLVDLAEEAVPAAGAAVGGLALVAVAAPVRWTVGVGSAEGEPAGGALLELGTCAQVEAGGS